MKNKFKYLIAAILIAVLTVSSSVYASAEEITDAPTVYETDGEAVNSPAENNSASANDTEEANFFSRIYSEITSYAGEILCALTFIGSLVLAMAYKKGLLPLLEKSLLSIGAAITKIKENTKEGIEKSSVVSEDINNKLTSANHTLETLAKRIEALGNALDENKKDVASDRLEKKQLYLILDAQIDMLYDVFMSASLPQYQKDAVGEKIARMKEAIAENGTGE